MLDVLNSNGLKTGAIKTSKEVHSKGLYHRAVQLYWINSKKELLCQRRSLNVEQYPGALSISLTGHVEEGETSTQALKREVFEELGLQAHELNLEFLFSYKQSCKISVDCIDRQFIDVFICQSDLNIDKIVLNKKEVAEVVWITLDEFEMLLKNSGTEFSKIYGASGRDFLLFIRTNLIAL